MKRPVWTLVWILFSAGLGFSQQTFYFPQIADGVDPQPANTHWHTTIFLSNQTTNTATGTVTFFQSNGSAMNISFVDDRNQSAASGNQISFQIPPGQSRKYTSVSSGNLQVGYGVVTSTATLAGNAMFAHWTNPPNEQLISEAGVPSSVLLPRQAVFADTQFGFNTGVAIANPGTAAMTVNFELFNNEGQSIATRSISLAPGEHVARFVTELFGSLSSLAGRLQFSTSGGSLTAVALRFDSRFERFTTLFPFSVP